MRGRWFRGPGRDDPDMEGPLHRAPPEPTASTSEASPAEGISRSAQEHRDTSERSRGFRDPDIVEIGRASDPAYPLRPRRTGTRRVTTGRSTQSSRSSRLEREPRRAPPRPSSRRLRPVARRCERCVPREVRSMKNIPRGSVVTRSLVESARMIGNANGLRHHQILMCCVTRLGRCRRVLRTGRV